jgi:hypothetical protein
MRSPRLVYLSFAACLLGCLVLAYARPRVADTRAQRADGNSPTPLDTSIADPARANELIRRQPGFFVPNLGQWDHAARFVYRNGPMTLFLEDRGWVLDLVERPVDRKTEPHAVHQAMAGGRDVDQKFRGVALRMTFEGDDHVPDTVGEKKFPGHHNYFLGDDESRWRTGVPLFGSVRYDNLYPGIDLRLREMNGVPEYDLLLQPGADLSLVSVHLEGGRGLSIASDGSLVIETALGPMTQSVPKTWQVGGDGRKREVICNFKLLGADRFGFVAPGWDGDSSLTIDPGLIWSTFVGGRRYDYARTLAVDASGVVTLAGVTDSSNFPTTRGAYDTIFNGSPDNVFVSRLDPRKSGSAQLVYSTFLGGTGPDEPWGLSVDARGVVTLAGRTWSAGFPTTRGAYSRTHSGNFGYGGDAFVSRLDPSKSGSAQLVYSTFLGGRSIAYALSVDDRGVMTVAGLTKSVKFPTTRGAYDTTFNGATWWQNDAFVGRLDPSKIGAAQLVYSTFLGGSGYEEVNAVSVDASGVVTVAGRTSSINFPTTRGAYDTTYGGNVDAFLCRLNPAAIGRAGLLYSTYLGGRNSDYAEALSVAASGAVTVAGNTNSTRFPTTSGAYDRTYNGGGSSYGDAFVSRLDPSKTGTAQLVYSTYLGGSNDDQVFGLFVDAGGVVTVAGVGATNFPTTRGAYNRIFRGYSDAFVSRLDPSKNGTAQLVYSTYLGGSSYEGVFALAVDASGVVTVTGYTHSKNFPTTSGAYDRTYNGAQYVDMFVSRLSMGVSLYGDVHDISIQSGGTQRLTVNAGKAHANRLYWIFGSETGTSPGVDLLGAHIPLNPDLYTIIAMSAPNGKEFTNFKGTLDANGLATASFNLPARLPFPPGFTFHHAYVVYDANGIFMTSNAVPLRLK